MRARRQAAESHALVKRRRRAWKAQERRKGVRIAETALANYESDERKFAGGEIDYRLKRAILSRAKKLMDSRYQHGLGLLASCAWLRPLKEWKPKGKSPNSQFRSLVKHLLVLYTMPEFLYSVFFEEDEDTRRVGVKLFRDLGNGASFYKLVKSGTFPVPLTKRMCHVFLQSTVKFGFLEAVRHAQVTVLGGDRRVAQAVTATRQLGRGFKDNEEFWATVVQWTCNQGMLAPGQLGPIYDWIGRQAHENPEFSMKGRTGLSVLRAVEEWHGDLAKERKIDGHKYDPSGFEPWYHERKVRLPSGGHHMQKHCITEVATSKELAAEGKKLSHCVYSYSWSIKRGQISIWSYRVDGERTLTVEVDNRNKRVMQCRGKSNRAPTLQELAQVRKWMQENGISGSSWLPMR